MCIRDSVRGGPRGLHRVRVRDGHRADPDVPARDHGHARHGGGRRALLHPVRRGHLMPRVPLSWLAEHVAVAPGTTAESLAADLVRVGLEEEAVHPATVTGPLVVGEVVERTPEPHSNGKTIQWCRVDVGAFNAADDDDAVAHLEVVRATDDAARAGAVLPGPFPITARRTRARR